MYAKGRVGVQSLTLRSIFAPARRGSARPIVNGPLKYDYLLVAGPGRSGSELLYERLRRHKDFAFPEIKEGYYYRSPSRFEKALAQANNGGEKRMLADAANLGYQDRALPPGVRRLADAGRKVLLVILLRAHRDRAVSMMRFRKSRGELSALFGARRLERAVVRDRLTPEALDALYGAGVDALTLHFSALTANTTGALNALASLCGAALFDESEPVVVNESVRARNALLAAAGKSVAVGMRRLGMRRLLQRIKDAPSVRRVFFTPAAGERDAPRLSEESARLLDESFEACRALAESASEPLGDGILFRAGRSERGARGGSAPSPAGLR